MKDSETSESFQRLCVDAWNAKKTPKHRNFKRDQLVHRIMLSMKPAPTSHQDSRDDIGPADKKRKRAQTACDECHKKRTKCDGGSPCGLCIKNMTFCTTSRKVAKRGPKAGHIERLESRVRILESLLTPDQWAALERLENSKSDMNASQTDEVFCLKYHLTLSYQWQWKTPIIT